MNIFWRPSSAFAEKPPWFLFPQVVPDLPRDFRLQGKMSEVTSHWQHHLQQLMISSCRWARRSPEWLCMQPQQSEPLSCRPWLVWIRLLSVLATSRSPEYKCLPSSTLSCLDLKILESKSEEKMLERWWIFVNRFITLEASQLVLEAPWSCLQLAVVSKLPTSSSWDGPPRTQCPAHPRLHLPPLTTKVMMVSTQENPEVFWGQAKQGQDKRESTLQGRTAKNRLASLSGKQGGSLTDILHLQSLRTKLCEARLFYYSDSLPSSSEKASTEKSKAPPTEAAQTKHKIFPSQTSVWAGQATAQRPGLQTGGRPPPGQVRHPQWEAPPWHFVSWPPEINDCLWEKYCI